MSNPLDCRSRLNVARKLSILNGRIILNVRNSKMSKSMFLTNQPTFDMNFLSYNNEPCYEKTCLRGSDPVRHEGVNHHANFSVLIKFSQKTSVFTLSIVISP